MHTHTHITVAQGAAQVNARFFCVSKVNNVDFRSIFREEAVLFLLKIPKGHDITILARRRYDGKPPLSVSMVITVLLYTLYPTPLLHS